MMPEQPQWSERTLDMPPQDPWADPPTAQVPPTGPPPSGPQGPAASTPPTAPFEASPFTRGRAQVNPRTQQPQTHEHHEPTGTGWPGAEPPRRSMNWNPRELRRGGEWSFAGLLFAFVCWGIWTISEGSGLMTPIIVFLVSVLVAGGLFALARVLGYKILEQRLGRVRRSARGAHLLAGLFLAGVGIAHLRQTGWVMDAYRWVAGLFS